ncbi:MAG TPA: AMP-binding protein [Streptosporangiaceae bacterium]|jgi:fatty-acyl-CoA synthase
MAPGPTFARILLARADDDATALLFEDERHTWAEVVAAARARAALARDLLADGAGPPHFGVLMDNIPEYVHWIGAAALSGTVLVGINPTRRGAGLAADIRHTDCRFVVTETRHLAELAGLGLGIPVLVTDDPAAPLDLARPDPSRAEPAPGDPLLLLFTSGSTGAPKAVVCSQGRLAVIAERGTALFDIGRRSVTYAAMPLFHGNSVMANLAPAVHAGATVVLRRRFSASGFLPDVRRYGVTYVNYVGRALAYILATPEGDGDAATPLARAFGTEASGPDMTAFARRFGCLVTESYGSSEGVISIRKTPGCPPDALGRPADGARVTIRDPETGRECAVARIDASGRVANPGEAVGEIVGEGVTGLFEGYYNNPEADAERLRGGMYYSGDLGYLDADGFVYFAGRGGDRLRVDGENFAAAPVERVLARWPAAVMCAVYPAPDPRTGDQVMAALEPRPGAGFDPAGFAAFLGSQPDLGTKWAPRFVRLVAEMPLTATGKVDKRPLRDAAWHTSDPVWWRPGRETAYAPFTRADADALRAEFARHGRTAVHPEVPG